MKRLVITLLLLAVPSIACSWPGNGIDLSWNDCVGGTTGPAANKNFACTGTANQDYTLVLQYKSSTTFTQASAWSATLDYFNFTGDLGDATTGFWRLEQNCPGNNIRGLGLSTTPPGGCVDAGIADVSDGGTTGMSAFAWFSNNDPNYQPAPGHAHINVAYARGYTSADGIDVPAGQNVFIFSLVFNNRNRTACSDGCTDEGVITWYELTVEGLNRDPVDIRGYDKFSDQVTINHGAPTAVQNSTWGRLKAMYR